LYEHFSPRLTHARRTPHASPRKKKKKTTRKKNAYVKDAIIQIARHLWVREQDTSS
jgi:hypothetical protein